MDARGTKDEDAALTRHGHALSELRYFEERLSYLREMEAEVRRRKAAGSYVKSTEELPVVKLDRLERKVAGADAANWHGSEARIR